MSPPKLGVQSRVAPRLIPGPNIGVQDWINPPNAAPKFGGAGLDPPTPLSPFWGADPAPPMFPPHFGGAGPCPPHGVPNTGGGGVSPLGPSPPPPPKFRLGPSPKPRAGHVTAPAPSLCLHDWANQRPSSNAPSRQDGRVVTALPIGRSHCQSSSRCVFGVIYIARGPAHPAEVPPPRAARLPHVGDACAQPIRAASVSQSAAPFGGWD